MMLNQAVIQGSLSPWHSPTIAVMKLDGSLRLCVDFKKVNTISHFDAFPMPQMGEL